MKETRKQPRIEAELSVQFPNEQGGYIEECIGNISKSGIFIETPTPLNRSTVVELLIRVPKSTEEITVQAEVMHTKPPLPDATVNPQYRAGMGLRFLMIEPKQKEYLRKFLEKLIDGHGAGSRDDPRIYLYREIDVKPKNVDEFKKRYMPNLSRGGLFLETNEDLTLFDPLEVVLHSPDAGEEPLRLACEVVNIRHQPGGAGVMGVGVKFTAVNKKIQKKIDAYIKAVLALES